MDFRDKDGAPLDQVVRRRGGLRRLAGVLARPPLRLHRPELREAHRRLGHPVAVQRAVPRRARAALRRPRVPARTPTTARRYGHDLVTGAAVDAGRSTGPTTRRAGRSSRPPIRAAARGAGRGISVLADHRPGRLPLPHPHQDRPRRRRCNDAAPDAFVQINAEDAARARASPRATWSRSSSRRGKVRAPARIGDIMPGHLFMPFHYGYWDDAGPPRAANELTLTELGPGQQAAALQVRRRQGGEGHPGDQGR